MIVSTKSLIEKLKENKPNGFEVSIRIGILNVTKAVYLNRGRFYVFNMEDDFVFSWKYGYTEEEFLKEHLYYFWEIEMTI